MILEVCALLSNLADLGEGKNLVTAAVGQDRPIPMHEAMKPAELPENIEARPNEKVISVSENDLGFEFSQFARTDRLDRSLGAHRHKLRGLDYAPSGGQSAP